MKKIYILLILVLTAGMTTAQNFSFWQSPEASNFGKMNPAGDSYPIGKIGDLYGFVRTEAYHHMDVCLVNKNMEVQKSVKLPDTKKGSVLFTGLNGNTAHIFVETTTRQNTSITHYIVNTTNMELVGKPQKLMDEKVGRDGTSSFFSATSPDGTFKALVALVYNAKTDNLSSTAYLYDDKATLQWKQKFDTRPISQIMVTDDGEIITAGFFETKTKKATDLYFCSITEDAVQISNATIDFNVSDMALMNYVNGKVVAATLNYDSKSNAKDLINSCTAIAYDMDADELVDANTYHFTAHDIHVIANDKNNSKDATSIANMVFRNTCATNYGGVAEMSQKWIEIVTHSQISNGMMSSRSTTLYIEKGMLLISVDTTGDFMWQRPIRHDALMSENSWCFMGSHLISDGDNVYAIVTEDDDCDTTYDTETHIKTATLNVVSRKSSMMCYDIDEAGNVKKHMLASNKYCFLGTQLMRDTDGTYYFISGNIRPTVLNTIRFE